jgi:MoxR-like ATPase
MQERSVSIDCKTFILPRPFMVVGTENPIEYQGTYPLPEAQLDRFLMKINVGYLSLEEEKRVTIGQKLQHPIEDLQPVLNVDKILGLQEQIKNVDISSTVLNYIVTLVSATRKKEEIRLGASPRASIALMKASSAWAFIEGRDYVIPEDVMKLAYWVLGHRIQLHPKALVAEKTAASLIAEIVRGIPVS